MNKKHPDYPKGVIAIYDSGPDLGADRYTAFYTRRGCGLGFHPYISGRQRRWQPKHPYVAMSATPFHPQGIGQHGEGVIGSHCGKIIRFADLPEDCQKLVHQDLWRVWWSRGR